MYNILEAKTALSRLIAALEEGEQKEIVIARNGRPVARLMPLAGRGSGPRIGLLEGRFKAPKNFDARNAEVARLFRKRP